MKKILLATVLLISFVATFMLRAQVSHAALFDGSKDAACQGINFDPANPQSCDQSAGTTASDLVRTGLNILSIVVGVAAVVVIMIAGLRYVVSQGDSNSVNGAKNAILYAIVGLVVTALAQVIVHFVLHKTTTTLPACPAGQSTLSNGKPCKQ